MQQKQNTYSISSGITYNSFFDNRFKLSRFSINFFLPLEKDKVTTRALLPAVLSNSCKKHPTFLKLNKHLDNLYGASLFSDVSRLGETQVLTFSGNFLSDKYALNNEKISLEFIDVVLQLIFNPLIVDGKFDEDVLKQEKREHAEAILAEFSDKRTYAKKRLDQLMFKNEKYSINKHGYIDEIPSITSQDLINTLQDVLTHARIEIFSFGDIDDQSVLEYLKKYFEKIDRTDIYQTKTEIIKTASKTQTFEEEEDISQGKLVMGFRHGVTTKDPQIMAMRVAIALFGATPHSKLFVNVREKKSLCYYCSSQLDKNKGTMFVQSGVEKQNIEPAIKEILKQLDDIKNGNFTEEEIDATKKSINNSFMATTDLLESLETFYLTSSLDDQKLSPLDIVKEINKVTKNQIQQAAQKISLDTIYTLTGKEGSK